MRLLQNISNLYIQFNLLFGLISKYIGLELLSTLILPLVTTWFLKILLISLSWQGLPMLMPILFTPRSQRQKNYCTFVYVVSQQVSRFLQNVIIQTKVLLIFFSWLLWLPTNAILPNTYSLKTLLHWAHIWDAPQVFYNSVSVHIIDSIILDNPDGHLVKEIIIPHIYMMMENFQGDHFSIALPPGASSPSLDFWDLKSCDAILSKLEFK